ncbi:MAG TPA: diguanylate cyclase [Acidobacteriaceae bacterium]|jgi:diguanylate cyclase (GGDEF)-like protein/PAS domain S-box-containing protein|nr:diguanylate cyclase [Acidobacteriaceae bacterium]
MAEGTAILADVLGAALNELEEGIAVLDAESRVLWWNRSAESITGYLSADLLGRTLPSDAYEIDVHHHSALNHATLNQATLSVAEAQPQPGQLTAVQERPLLVHLHHRQGHSLPAMLRRKPLRDELGKRFGTLLRFHPVEEIDTLPHGVADEDGGHENRVEQSQADMEDRLDEAWREWSTNGVPFGLMWITIDQAALLRKTHGRDASEAMLGIVERTLLHGLRPTEILGRWGANEFLVVCHERTREMLDSHAHRIGSLARSADFRWWGDRVSLTVSIGVAQAEETDTLRCLLKRAQRAMEEGIHAGGNRVTFRKIMSAEDQKCSQL